MRTFTNIVTACLISALPFAFTACSDDSDDGEGGNGATAGSSSQSDDDQPTAGTAGSSSQSDDDQPTAGTSSEGGTGGTSASGDSGAAGTGDEPVACDLSYEGTRDLPTDDVPTDIDGTETLTSGTVWKLTEAVYVMDGGELEIEPCTRIEGEVNGLIVVQRGGKIMAEGTADDPIVMTSGLEPGQRGPGDWLGLILLGRAPNWDGDEASIEGLDASAETMHGGDDAGDSSGVLSYVRVEFSGAELSADNEINGVSFGSVGSGTQVDHVMVNTTLDDCFEFFGGTVNVDHLVCNNGGDDMFDADQGYQGEMDTLFGRQVIPLSSDPNGFEMDSSTADKTPVSTVEVSNVTLCGIGETAASGTTYGMVLREGLQGELSNIVATGFDYGADLRDAGTDVDITDSTLYGMNEEDVGEPDESDDDEPMDEDDWFAADDSNSTSAPGYSVSDCGKARGPNAKVTGSEVGAFADESDWLDGSWIDWAAE